MEKIPEDTEHVDYPQERRYSADGRRVSVVDDVFGQICDDGPNYRDIGWMGTAVLMMKTQIGLGVLSIPAVLDVLGMVPGIVVLIAIAIITTWSDYMVGVFKLRHRSVYGIDDVGQLLFGRVGREFFGVVFVLCTSCNQRTIIFSVLTRAPSLGLRGRRRHARHINRLERRLRPRCLYRHLRRCGCHHRLRAQQHPNPRKGGLAGVGRCHLHSVCQ